MSSKARMRALLSWSTGKDSAWTLHVLRQDAQIDVVGLLTTFNTTADRVAMHAVRRKLVQAQVEATGLPLISVELTWPCPNGFYEERMREALQRAVAEFDIAAVAFGDLFLDDVRRYRQEKMAQCGLVPLFPLWQQPTDALAREMIAAGLKSRLTCIDPQHLPATFVGREFDKALLQSLPRSVDPCGERGEFHTFAYSGPMFDHALEIENGKIVEREGFVFADLLPRRAGHEDRIAATECHRDRL